MDFKQAIAQFASHLQAKGKSPLTVKLYTETLNKMPFNSVLDITVESVEKVRADFVSRGYKARTSNLYFIVLRSFLNYLRDELDIQCLAPRKVLLSKDRREYKQIDLVSKDELKRYLSYEDNVRDDLMVNMLFATGLRISELLALNLSDLEGIDEFKFHVVGKGGKTRLVFLKSPRTAKLLTRYLSGHPKQDITALFISNRGKRLSKSEASTIIKKRSDYLGMSKPVTAHTLRHYFATQMLENGADINAISELLGHSSIVTTQMYLHVSNKFLEDTYLKYHSDL